MDIKHPLTHLIRNAIDHGLETPVVRLATGKPAAGTVRLSVYREGARSHSPTSPDSKSCRWLPCAPPATTASPTTETRGPRR